mmetsp:Transcript_16524/g.44276  ORF Transcript_16524/g.44276 Transcript_16524/m.44276 type:complete len:208 (-) Transcript_16524:164-787(-)
MRGDGVVRLAQRVVGVACSQPQVCPPALAAHLDAAPPPRAAQAALGAVEGEARTRTPGACPQPVHGHHRHAGGRLRDGHEPLQHARGDGAGGVDRVGHEPRQRHGPPCAQVLHRPEAGRAAGPDALHVRAQQPEERVRQFHLAHPPAQLLEPRHREVGIHLHPGRLLPLGSVIRGVPHGANLCAHWERHVEQFRLSDRADHKLYPLL